MERRRALKKQRRGGWEPVANAEALINNPSAQPGANIAPIDEIVRVSHRLFDCGGAQGGGREEQHEMPAERGREINVCVSPECCSLCILGATEGKSKSIPC